MGSYTALGAYATNAKISPATVPAAGSVITHDAKILANSFQFTARHSPLARPTPTVAPVMHCVVEMGKPSCAAGVGGWVGGLIGG